MRLTMMLSTALLALTQLGCSTAAPHNVTAAAPAASEAHADADADADADAVITWSELARRAIVPPGPDALFGTENYGSKFPGEAAVYMGLVHAVIADAAESMRGESSSSVDVAIATATHHTLIGLQPTLGLSAARRAALDATYDDFIAARPDETGRSRGIALGARIAAQRLAERTGDGHDRNPALEELDPPSEAPGIWTAGGRPALGLRLPGIRPLVLESAGQFRPRGPDALDSERYARDFEQVATLGRINSHSRTREQTEIARFWLDHDIRQWNDALIRLVREHRLDRTQAARMMAMAHVAGGDAMIACFDAKYAYWFWRPFQAIPLAERDGNDATQADEAWRALAETPNFPEYPSAHACHTGAVVEALTAFFGTDEVPLTLDSRVARATHRFARLSDAVREVNQARVLSGFHFFNSDVAGEELGRTVARHVVKQAFAQESANP